MQTRTFGVNFRTPNLINICVDQFNEGEIGGRFYHCYNQEPIQFANVVELLREAEKLFDDISFPQASTKTRSFVEKIQVQARRMQRPEPVVDQESVVSHNGELGTFVTTVKFRQNSTWQGEFYWLEGERAVKFSNTLDFIKQIVVALQ